MSSTLQPPTDEEVAPYRSPAFTAHGGPDMARGRLSLAYVKLRELLPDGAVEALVRQLETLDDAYPEGEPALVVRIARKRGAWRYVRFKPEAPELLVTRRDR
jgi:hypothetical protein